MRIKIWTAGLALLAPALATGQSDWKVVGSPEDSHVVHADVAFHQHAISDAEALLLDISDPDSKSFGQHLDREALEEMFAPSQDSQDKVLQWLESVGISARSVTLRKVSATMRFQATVDQMKRLLSTEYRIVQHARSGVFRLDSSGYNIPGLLEDHVHSVTWISLELEMASQGIQKIGNNIKTSLEDLIEIAQQDGPFDFSQCQYSWTPECIRNLYGIPLGTKAAPNNSLGIFGFIDLYDQADLNKFWKKYATFIKNGTGPVVKSVAGGMEDRKHQLVKGKAPKQVAGEEGLDLQVAFPIAHPASVTVYQTAFHPFRSAADDLLDAFDRSYCTHGGGDGPSYDPAHPLLKGSPGSAVCGTLHRPNVLSISFGTQEHDTDAEQVQRQCHECMKLALGGMTVVVASGDAGVAGIPSELHTCLPGSGNRRFAPIFPASCPYVTAVGATQVNFVGSKIREVAVYDRIYSGGGFSNYNAQPAYQKQSVKQYLANNNPGHPPGTFNQSGRAYPDVAMLGSNVIDSYQGEFMAEAGTSASAPIFAAMINRINDERLLAGKKPIGFLNQILYKHPEIFTDITQGSNPGCGTAGFFTAKGWDPVTGLGSTQFPKLRSLLFGLP